MGEDFEDSVDTSSFDDISTDTTDTSSFSDPVDVGDMMDDILQSHLKALMSNHSIAVLRQSFQRQKQRI